MLAMGVDASLVEGSADDAEEEGVFVHQSASVLEEIINIKFHSNSITSRGWHGTCMGGGK